MWGYIDRNSHNKDKALHVISAKGAYGSGDMGQILEGYSCCDLKFEQSRSIGFRKDQQGMPLDCFHKTGLGKIWARDLDWERKQDWKKQ